MSIYYNKIKRRAQEKWRGNLTPVLRLSRTFRLSRAGEGLPAKGRGEVVPGIYRFYGGLIIDGRNMLRPYAKGGRLASRPYRDICKTAGQRLV